MTNPGVPESTDRTTAPPARCQYRSAAPAPAAPTSSGWVPAAMAALGVVVALMACAFGAFLAYACPTLREPLSVAAGIAGVLCMVAALIVSMCRR
ncbi:MULTISPECIES: hypothetical protein [Streptomyces]|uniref:hypothetical protein n=1 Tax=Streptomyces TaxID=1883 RepID=UPI0021A63009|nr:hypothetical protein [Streptomyces atratus]MCT2543338.1 hypothetical protein [Streptomyces atratus]